MRITAEIDVSGIKRKLDLLVSDLKEFDDKVLKPFSAEKREEVQARFDQGGPGWAPRKASTIARAPMRALSPSDREIVKKIPGGDVRAIALLRLNRKLNRELRRAEKSKASRYIKAAADKREKTLASSTRAVERRKQVIAELDRIASGGSTEPTGDKKADKRTAKLMERLNRAEGRASRKVLGRIASSIKATVGKGLLTLESQIPWAGSHNVGGQVGNGATLPARTFLEWTDADLVRVVELCRENALMPAFE